MTKSRGSGLEGLTDFMRARSTRIVSCATAGIAKVKIPAKSIANIVKAVNFCFRVIFEIIKRLL